MADNYYNVWVIFFTFSGGNYSGLARKENIPKMLIMKLSVEQGQYYPLAQTSW